MKEALNRNLDLWEEDLPLLNNLETVLDVELPSRTTSSREDWSVECGICYSFTLGQELPTIACQGGNR